MKNDKITYEPIGIIHSPYNSSEGVPIQPTGAENVEGVIELDIKPYVSDFDKVKDSKFGWLEKSAHLSATTKSDKRFNKDPKGIQK